jgi:hypothetical protein
MGIALLFTLLAVVWIVPMFLGCWRLGRKVSMSPLEKRLMQQDLKGIDSNAEVRKLMGDIGSSGVQYDTVTTKLSRTE